MRATKKRRRLTVRARVRRDPRGAPQGPAAGLVVAGAGPRPDLSELRVIGGKTKQKK